MTIGGNTNLRRNILFYYILLILTYFFYLLIFKNFTFHEIFVSKTGIFFLVVLLFLLLFDMLSGNYINLKNRKKSSISNYLIKIGFFLFLLGLLISLNLRNSYELLICEGQRVNFKNLLLELERVNIGKYKKNLLFSKKVEGVLEIQEKKEIIKLFPPRKISNFYIHTTSFGIAPYILIRNKKGSEIFSGFVLLGTFLDNLEDMHIIGKVKAPQVMLGVGYFPPLLDDLFRLNNFPYRFYLKITKGSINNKIQNLKKHNYYLYITNGRVRKPEYYLIILKGNKILYKGNIKRSQEIKFEGGSIQLKNKLRYYLGIQLIKDYGLNIVVAGIIFIFIGTILCVSKKLLYFIKFSFP